MNRKKIRFVINPVSGIGKKKKLENNIRTLLGDDLFSSEIVYTSHAGHATELAKLAIQDKIDIFCVVGGDGSVHEAAKALKNSETALAIIPAGSGNGIARELGIPQRPQDAIRQLRISGIKKMDTCTLNGQFFLGFAGIGFDAHIANVFKNAKVRGLRGYAREVLREFKKYDPPRISYYDGDKKKESKIFVASFMNVGQYGNNFWLDDHANPSDGKISLCLIRPFPFMKLGGLLLRSRRKKLSGSGYLSTYRNSEIKLFLDTPFPLHLDGEDAGICEGEIIVTCDPGSLKIFC